MLMKTDKRKGEGSHTKSFHIKLPDDHPIFTYPKNQRSRVAREWMEQGRQVLSALEEIKQELADIKSQLNKNNDSNSINAELNDDAEKGNQSNNIDPKIFLNL